MSISIAKGLKATYKNAREYTLSQTFLELDKYTDNYEVLKPDFNRVYGDIDGKDINVSEDEFLDLDLATRTAIEKFLDQHDYCLLTASSFAHKKISWRFVLKNKKTTLAANKQWVKNNLETINLPKGISFDTAPYNKNQKIRMLGSNKDGENRPLRLVKGEKLDTLISYLPENCQELVVPLPVVKTAPSKNTSALTPTPTTHKEGKKQTLSSELLTRLVMNIQNTEQTEWELWYKVAQAIYNEGGPLDLFLNWSRKSPKHNEQEAIKQFSSLREGGDVKLTSGSLFYWSAISNLEAHKTLILETCSPDEYQYQKILFEKDHFKLKNPVCFVRVVKDHIQILKQQDLLVLYGNLYCSQGPFVKLWLKDPYIRTYESVVFKPNQSLVPGEFNLFQGFPTNRRSGSIDVVSTLLYHLSGKQQDVFDYLQNYFAHLVQKPQEKPGICLVFMSEKQGAGKDTFLDFIGRILGQDYFYNTNDAENSVFGRFTSHLQKTLLLKMEEVDFETNKKNESRLLSLITAPFMSYEGKGKDAITLNDYKRIVMTTNKAVPVNIPDSDRRFVLIRCSEDHVGDIAYWNKTYAELEKPETLEAYYDFLASRDISNFQIRLKPNTDFYKEVKQTLRPYHAAYFQNWVSANGDVLEEEDRSATEWLKDMNQNRKFVITLQKLARDLKGYVEAGAIDKRDTKYGTNYKIKTKQLFEYLKSKSWWIDL